MQVSDILKEKGDRIVSTGPGARIEEVARLLKKEGVGAALVRADDGALMGIISERDIVRGVAQHGSGSMDMLASDLMTASVISCDLEMDTEELMEMMLESRVRHLPVVRDGSLLAIISIGDVVKAVFSEIRWMRSALQDHVVKSAAWSTEEDPD